MCNRRVGKMAAIGAIALGALGTVIRADDKSGGRSGMSSESARKLFIPKFDANAAAAKLARSKDPTKRSEKDIDWIPDSVVQVINTGGRLPPLQQLGISYKIVVMRGTYTAQVPESFVFQSGDQFKLILQCNAPATLQILHKGSSGNGKVLYPHPNINGGSDQLPAYQECMVPPTGWFRFDEKPGTEELILLVTGQGQAMAPAAQPIQAMVTQSITSSSGQPAASAGAVISVADWSLTLNAAIQNHHKSIKAGKTKDIVYVDEGQSVIPPSTGTPPESAGQPLPNQTCVNYLCTTTVEPQAMLIHTVHLNHK